MPRKQSDLVHDATRLVAERFWNEFPNMRPVGIGRIRRHITELESVLSVVPESELHIMILKLKDDKWRRDWVSSFARIAQELPRIRVAVRTEPERDSFVKRYRNGE